MNPSEVAQADQRADVQCFRAGESEIAVIEFEGALRDSLVEAFRAGYLTTGNYLPDARAVSPQGVMSMAVAGAAISGSALSGALSSTLYMATADPASLMKLGQGVGSAVMGASGIKSQAAFLPVASSVPVVAPLMAMQAISTAVTLRQFEQVDGKLTALQASLKEVVARTEATHAGELITASRVIDEVFQQYEGEGIFTGDMLSRLAVAESDVRTLAERSRLIVSSQNLDDMPGEKIKQANYDAYSAMLASFLDLKLSHLRVCVDMQEHPNSVVASLERLREKIMDGLAFWDALLSRSQRVKKKIDERTRERAGMSRARQRLTSAVSTGGSTNRDVMALNESYTTILEFEKVLMKGFDSLVESAEKTLRTLEQRPLSDKGSPTLVFWRDEAGDHSFYSNDLRLT